MSADQDNLEAWLREHPEARNDLADLLRLRELYQAAGPPEPDEFTWNTVYSHIREPIDRGRLRPPWWAIAAGSAAAAILVIFLAHWWRTSEPGLPTTTVQRVQEPFPVAEPDDVTIISMDARDVAALVVGEPPVGGDLEFARPEDIQVIHCERCPHTGRLARLEPGDEVPMFVTVAAVAPGNDN